MKEGKFEPEVLIDNDGNLKITGMALVEIPGDIIAADKEKLKELAKRYPVNDIPIDFNTTPYSYVLKED